MAATEIKPIRTERDYDAALKEVERLWGAKVGTPEGDQLDVLATLIDAYETEHYPMDPPDPVEAVKFRMDQQGLTRRDLEKIIGTRTRIGQVQTRTINHDDPPTSRASWHLGRRADSTKPKKGGVRNGPQHFC